MADDDVAPVVPFFKKKAKTSSSNGSVVAASSSVSSSRSVNGSSTSSTTTARRKRSASPEDARKVRDDDSGPAVVRQKKREQYNPLKQATSNKRKRGNGVAGEASDDDEHDDTFSVSYADRPTNAQRAGLLNRNGKDADDESEILEGDAALAKMGETPADGLYHGASKYQSQLPTGASKYAPIKGPSANIKTITLMDYQADVCKDYKETGWCGFGDSCKFLHAREDYLHGWQMDSILPGLSDKAKAVEEVVEEELPFACLICREPFSAAPHDAVVTRCGHYFGSSCAIARFRKTPKCFACGASTGGIFNKATKILERREKNQKERMRQKEQTEGADDPYAEKNDAVEIEGLEEA